MVISILVGHSMSSVGGRGEAGGQGGAVGVEDGSDGSERLGAPTKSGRRIGSARRHRGPRSLLGHCTFRATTSLVFHSTGLVRMARTMLPTQSVASPVTTTSSVSPVRVSFWVTVELPGPA